MSQKANLSHPQQFSQPSPSWPSFSWIVMAGIHARGILMWNIRCVFSTHKDSFQVPRFHPLPPASMHVWAATRRAVSESSTWCMCYVGHIADSSKPRDSISRAVYQRPCAFDTVLVWNDGYSWSWVIVTPSIDFMELAGAFFALRLNRPCLRIFVFFLFFFLFFIFIATPFIILKVSQGES